MLEQGEMSAQSVGFQAFSKEDGSLDPLRLKAAWEGFSPQVRNPGTRECPFFCWDVATGYIPSHRQAMLNGYQQSPSNFGRTGTFNMISCVINSPGADVKINAIGCGPAAFTGVMLRKYVIGKPVFGTRYGTSTGLSTTEFKQRISAPLGLRGRPLIANYMGTCWNGGGAMTIGKGFADGAREFLRNHASSLRTDQNFSHGGGNVTSAPRKAEILVSEIGINNNPVVAEYFRGAFRGHYSPVTQYKIFYGVTVGVSVKTMDDRNKYHSLSEAHGVERGVFFVY